MDGISEDFIYISLCLRKQKNVEMLCFIFLWANARVAKKIRKNLWMKRAPSVKKWSEDDDMTAALCSLMEHYRHRQHRRSTLFTCLWPFSLYTHLCEIFLKRIACLLNHQFEKGASSVSISPELFLPPPLYLSMPPPINPSLSWRLPCANLYSLSHAKHLSCPHWMPLQSNLHLSGCKAF